MNIFAKRLHSERWRAPWSCDPALTRGRLCFENQSPTRSDFQRDRDRIIHSAAFRRLKHKTQVFVYHEGDHYRTRLTHTIEVAQIARSLARALGLDEDLAETLALAHDLGHTPFGHVGEDALHACMEGYGGFDHNAQALRIVTRLERRYADFDGLNLTWESLEGLVKHNGPLCDIEGNPIGRYAVPGVSGAILEYNELHDLELWSFASAEAQAAAIADDIAYNAADIDDGLRAGFFKLEDLRAIPFMSGLIDEVDASYPGIERFRAAHEVVRRLITRLVEDVIAVGEQMITELRPESASDIRQAREPVITFSPEFVQADKDIKEFLFANMYRHPHIMHVREGAERVVRDLFGCFLSRPQLMPAEWQIDQVLTDEARLRRRVADYIAGMTDSYAIDAHKRLFDDTPELR